MRDEGMADYGRKPGKIHKKINTAMEIRDNINNADLELNAENIKAQMRKGVLEYCILSILEKREAYASSILEELKAANMIVVEGPLYPLLIRQKNQGLLSYRWEESTQGPPRKYYCITDKGRQQLGEMDQAWQEIVDTIKTIKGQQL